jgi:sirohydrochlorin cobaltochelatase
MQSKKTVVSFVLVFILASFASAFAGEHRDARPQKKGILLVGFGSSVPQAQVSFENIDKKVKEAFPEIPVRWAYTSAIIRHKMAKEGKQMDSVEVALAKMMDEGFTHVAVQSLHTIGGEEYHDLHRNAHAFSDMAGGFQRILVGYPLLAKHEDLVRVSEAMISHIPPERKKDEAVVFMGHGTPHPANAFYEAGINKAYLMPFMSVAGDHARNDMAGDEPDSWKSILTKAGITSVPILKGTAEYDDIVDIWVDHLKGVMSHF